MKPSNVACTRPLSTTTRIKTTQYSPLRLHLSQVRDHCPLQQGLRLQVTLSYRTRCSSTRPLSTTTRIKTLQKSLPTCNRLSTRPLSTTTRIKTRLSRMLQHTLCKCTRPLSTTTRIKTLEPLSKVPMLLQYETIVHYNKD